MWIPAKMIKYLNLLKTWSCIRTSFSYSCQSFSTGKTDSYHQTPDAVEPEGRLVLVRQLTEEVYGTGLDDGFLGRREF